MGKDFETLDMVTDFAREYYRWRTLGTPALTAFTAATSYKQMVFSYFPPRWANRCWLEIVVIARMYDVTADNALCDWSDEQWDCLIVSIMFGTFYNGRRKELHDRRHPLVKALCTFYKDYVDWVDAGAPESLRFDRGWGLCLSFDHWWERYSPSGQLACKKYGGGESVCQLMRDQLSNYSGDDSWAYPFGGSARYDWESLTKTAYKNRERYMFAKERM